MDQQMILAKHWHLEEGGMWEWLHLHLEGSVGDIDEKVHVKHVVYVGIRCQYWELDLFRAHMDSHSDSIINLLKMSNKGIHLADLIVWSLLKIRHDSQIINLV